MIKKITSSILLLMLLSGLTNCASIIHGSRQKVDFNSQPTGARILIDGKDYGTTPNSISLRRKGREVGEPTNKREYNVSIQMEGYYPYDVKIKRDLDGWLFGNIIFGGIIGIIIDASNGSMYRLTPNQINVQLNRTTASIHRNQDDRLQIGVVLQADPTWEKIGTLKKINE
ncbi:MAG: PEGA domain-containing protein [Chryseotalea sp.]|jgi:hypothetical protein|nr:PEGA domain-containing protein [Flammeovirgaceae bacterium]